MRQESKGTITAIGGSMSEDLRYQRKCYYASSAYSESFWGKFIYIYQGKGHLHLTKTSLSLERSPENIEIPLSAIEDIRLDRFSSWAKPLGLSRLTVSYTQGSELTTIHLVPHESPFDPTTITSKLVASLYETLRGVKSLANRMQSAPFEPEPSPSFGKGTVYAVCFVIPFAVAGLLIWFFSSV